MAKRNYSSGGTMKGGVGCYTDSNPGLVRDRSVDDAGNTKAGRSQPVSVDANDGYAAPLPNKD